jgi:hypothetical protein
MPSDLMSFPGAITPKKKIYIFNCGQDCQRLANTQLSIKKDSIKKRELET